MQKVKSNRDWDANSSITNNLGTVNFDEKCEAEVSNEMAALLNSQGKVTLVGKETKEPTTTPAVEVEVVDVVDEEVIDPNADPEPEAAIKEPYDLPPPQNGITDTDPPAESTPEAAPEPLSEQDKADLVEVLSEHSNKELKAILTEGEVVFKGNASNGALIDLIVENNLI
tara:strand:- start:91931 stop:92440 length:510 start_codon:yes stop_codon:yes gene_type:complete